MPQTIPSKEASGEESSPTTDGRRLGLTLGLLVLPMYVALGAPSVALPAIGRELAVPFGATAWILAAWSLTSALAMPVAGGLLARWNPFQVLVAGVVILAAGSALAGFGPTLPVVIAGRLIGGAGAGATVIAVFAAATALPRRDRIRALGIIAAASATASGSGTLLGGAVTAWLGWRAVLAIPVLALPLLLAALPSGSYVAISHGVSDTEADQAIAGVTALYRRTDVSTAAGRSRTEILRFFGDAELVPPGLVWVHQWPEAPEGDSDPGDMAVVAAIARIP